MWENRQPLVKKNPRIVLDKRFLAAQQMELGDSGQATLDGIIDAERLEFQEDGVERIIKTVLVTNFKILENKPARA